MSNVNTATNTCTLEVSRLFESINEGRKMRSLPPVENSAMASRCNLRFNLDKNRAVDFTQPTITISAEDINVLEQLVNEQFDCNVEGVVSRLCIKPKKAVSPEPPLKQETPLFSQQPDVHTSEKTGLMSKIKKMLGK